MSSYNYLFMVGWLRLCSSFSVLRCVPGMVHVASLAVWKYRCYEALQFWPVHRKETIWFHQFECCEYVGYLCKAKCIKIMRYMDRDEGVWNFYFSVWVSKMIRNIWFSPSDSRNWCFYPISPIHLFFLPCNCIIIRKYLGISFKKL